MSGKQILGIIIGVISLTVYIGAFILKRRILKGISQGEK